MRPISATLPFDAKRKTSSARQELRCLRGATAGGLSHGRDWSRVCAGRFVCRRLHGDCFGNFNGAVVADSPIDPHCHEVLMQEPSDQEEGMVIEELQKGYWLADRVVRTSKVKVAIKKEN